MSRVVFMCGPADQLVASGKYVSAFVTYDQRLAEAARACSFSVVVPGTQGWRLGKLCASESTLMQV